MQTKLNISIGKRRTFRALSILALTGFFVGPAAAESVDLSDPNVTAGQINGATFMVDGTQPSGTGIFGRSSGGVFLTIQNKGTEEGYNTSGGNVMDTKRTPQWNHNLLYSDLGVVDYEGAAHVPFLLDINESYVRPTLSLDDFKIFTGSVGSLMHDSLDGLLNDPSLTLRYSMDDFQNDTNSFVLLDYARNSRGSGMADMAALVPLDFFGDTSLTDYVYVYAKFGGDVAGAGSDAGFEEWTAGVGAPIPEPSSALMFGLASMVLIFRSRNRRWGR